VLETESEDVLTAETKLKEYYNKILNPAIAYVFSKGAPTPKILANIIISYPTGIGITTTAPNKYKINEEKFGKVYSQIESKGIVVCKTPKYIIIVSKSNLSHEV